MVNAANLPGVAAQHNPPGSKAYRIIREYAALRPEHFDGKLRDDYVQRICNGNTGTLGSVYPYTTAGQPFNTYSWDIAAGIIHGYEKKPEVLDSWTGSGFMSLVDHAVAVGGYPVAVPLFGLNEELVDIVKMSDLHEMAGAARLAVKNTKAPDIPSYGYGAKFLAGGAPALDTNMTIRKSLMFAAFPHYVPLIELIGDVDMDVIHDSLRRLHGARDSSSTTLGYVAALMVRAEREGLPLGECLRVWSLIPGQMELVFAAVRNGIPDEYLESLAETR